MQLIRYVETYLSSSASYDSAHAYQSDFLGPTSLCKSQVDASLYPEAGKECEILRQLS